MVGLPILALLIATSSAVLLLLGIAASLVVPVPPRALEDAEAGGELEEDREAVVVDETVLLA